MTYLQLVNAVLRRLREEQAGTVNESDYTQMIGDFVNDAKRQVEDAWDWSALRQDIDVLTVAGVNEYHLDAAHSLKGGVVADDLLDGVFGVAPACADGLKNSAGRISP